MSRPSLLVRAWHDLTRRDEYALGADGLLHEYCYSRRTGALVREKTAEPTGDRPNFQPVGGA